MNLGFVDWLIILAYFALSLVVGLYYARRAGRSTEEYFLSGRTLPWWLAGTSMVATTFAADTPLAVTEMVARHGVAGNWLWWSMLAGGMLTVFFFARLWRRAEVLTDVEFVELRYAGRRAAFLRGFRALYLGLPINLIIMGWVNLGMAKVLSGTLGLPKWQALALCLGITFLYSTLSGFWGVVVTDAVQFVIAMLGSVALAVFAVRAVGGLGALEERLAGVAPAGAGEPFGAGALDLWSDGSAPWMLPALTLAVYLSVNWWASWYPGSEPGGGGYVAQRIFAAKDERHGLLATLWFNVAHYALRPWPWILVALCSLVLYPGGTIVNPETGLADPAFGYVRVMNDYLPAGFRGLLLASFAAAYMSTISTQMNWGASYLVNDFYRRFVRREASERHYVAASRVATLVVVLLSTVVTYYMNRITGGWELIMSLGAGTGLVYILRWYWWRVNAWSEVAAMSAALVVSLWLRYSEVFDANTSRGFAQSILTTVGITTLVWLLATFLTRPEPEETLARFYARVRPAGPGWRRVAAAAGLAERRGEIAPNLLNWALGVGLIYAVLFATGAALFGRWGAAALYAAVALACGALMSWNLNRTRWAGLAETEDGVARRLPRLMLAVALCAGAAGARAQTAPPPPEQDDVVSVKSNLVNLDVMVRGRDGKYATDLKADDFVVYENGTPQTVVFFDPPPAGGAEGRAASATPSAAASQSSNARGRRPRNLISLVLDGQTTDVLSLKRVRDGVVKFIRERVGEDDAVALFAVSGGLQLLHPFTNDKARLVAAVERSYSAGASSKSGEAAAIADSIAQLRDRSGGAASVAAAAASPGVGQMTAGPAQAELAMIDRTLQQFLAFRSTLSLQQSRPLLAALAAICEGQRSVPGRKTLVLFSQGFVSPAVLDWQVRSTIDLANRANVAIYVVDSAGLRGGAPTSGALVPQSPLGGISGLVPQEERIRASGGENVFDRARFEGLNREYDILYRISEESGGKFFKGSNDIGKGLERVDEELRARYTIGYQSTDPNLDGGFRKVRVEVRRPGAAVITRAGYRAIPPGDISPLSPDDRKLLAGFAEAEASPGLPLAVELVAFRSGGGLYVVPVSLEVPPGALTFERKGDRQRMQLDVLGVVREGREKVLSRLGGNFDVSLTAEQYQAITGDQVFYRQDLELPPGEYTLELLVRDRLSGKTAAKRERLVLPEAGTEFAASGVMLSRRAEPARGPGPDVLREGDALIRPTPRREFNAADNLIIFFKLYHATPDAATGRPQVRVTVILTRDGKAAAKPVGYDLTGPTAGLVPHLSFAKFFPLKGLPPGRYEAVIEARDMVTLKLLKQRASFVIKP